MKPILFLKCAVFALITPLSAALSQPVTTGFSVSSSNTSYADIADLVVISPLIVDATVRKITKIPAEQAVGVPLSVQRLLVEADVGALIRGNDGIAGQVRFLLDVPKDAKGNIDESGITTEKEAAMYVFGDNGEKLPSHAIKGFENLEKVFNEAVSHKETKDTKGTKWF